MQDTKGLLNKFKHHARLPLMLNEDCKIDLPADVLDVLLQPHKLGYYYFVYMEQGAATYYTDTQHIPLTDSQMVFGIPNQIFHNPQKDKSNHYNSIGFDDSLLALLPKSYAFLLNPANSNKINFSPEAKLRVRTIFSMLFQLIHLSGKEKNTEIILAYLNILLTEFNNAYFENSSSDSISNTRLSKYIEFKLAVESQLTEQHDIQTIAESISMTTSGLYGLVKEYAGVSPKEWITNRLIQEAQRKLQYTNTTSKELAYELGFNDPAYFSRRFKKSTGKSVSEFLRDLSQKYHD